MPIKPETGTVPAQDGTLWPRVAAKLQELNPAVYAAWFAGLMYLDRDGDHIVMTAPTEFVCSYIQSHLHAQLLAMFVAEDRSVRGLRIIPLSQVRS